MNVLIVFELVPEDTKLFLIPLSTYEEHWKWLDDCHRKLINVHDCVAIKHLCSAAYTEDGENGPLFDSEVDSSKPLEADICKVIITGMVL